MNEDLLSHLFAAYQRDPTTLIELPADDIAQEALFETLRLTLRNATMRGESVLASVYQSFAWEIARQKGQWQHQAVAHWCSGIAQFNHDPRMASKELAQALTLYQEHNDVKYEARVLVG